MNEEWRKQLQKKLDGHRQAAPQLSWNQVESQLALASGKTKTPFWGQRIMAAAAMVALIGGAGVAYLLLNNSITLHKWPISNAKMHPNNWLHSARPITKWLAITTRNHNNNCPTTI